MLALLHAHEALIVSPALSPAPTVQCVQQAPVAGAALAFPKAEALSVFPTSDILAAANTKAFDDFKVEVDKALPVIEKTLKTEVAPTVEKTVSVEVQKGYVEAEPVLKKTAAELQPVLAQAGRIIVEDLGPPLQEAGVRLGSALLSASKVAAIAAVDAAKSALDAAEGEAVVVSTQLTAGIDSKLPVDPSSKAAILNGVTIASKGAEEGAKFAAPIAAEVGKKALPVFEQARDSAAQGLGRAAKEQARQLLAELDKF